MPKMSGEAFHDRFPQADRRSVCSQGKRNPDQPDPAMTAFLPAGARQPRGAFHGGAAVWQRWPRVWPPSSQFKHGLKYNDKELLLSEAVFDVRVWPASF